MLCFCVCVVCVVCAVCAVYVLCVLCVLRVCCVCVFARVRVSACGVEVNDPFSLTSGLLLPMGLTGILLGGLQTVFGGIWDEVQ